MNILRESITRIQTVMPYFTVRIWREEPIDGEVDHKAIQAEVVAAKDINDTCLSFARKLLQMPRVNAVEVKNYSECGEVLYRDWP